MRSERVLLSVCITGRSGGFTLHDVECLIGILSFLFHFCVTHWSIETTRNFHSVLTCQQLKIAQTTEMLSEIGISICGIFQKRFHHCFLRQIITVKIQSKGDLEAMCSHIYGTILFTSSFWRHFLYFMSNTWGMGEDTNAQALMPFSLFFLSVYLFTRRVEAIKTPQMLHYKHQKQQKSPKKSFSWYHW